MSLFTTAFVPSSGYAVNLSHRTKKADVVAPAKAFDHVGLFTAKPPVMTGLLFNKSSDRITELYVLQKWKPMGTAGEMGIWRQKRVVDKALI